MQLDYPSPQDNIQSVELANRWSTAMHEAGLAVVSHYLQIGIRGVISSPTLEQRVTLELRTRKMVPP